MTDTVTIATKNLGLAATLATILIVQFNLLTCLTDEGLLFQSKI